MAHDLESETSIEVIHAADSVDDLLSRLADLKV